MKHAVIWAACLLAVVTCSQTPVSQVPEQMETQTEEPATWPKAMVVGASVEGVRVPASGSVSGVGLSPEIALEFTREVKADEASLSFVSFTGGNLQVRRSESDATVLLFTPVETLQPFRQYRFTLAEGECFGVTVKKAYTVLFTTGGDDATDKFPRITDEELLDLVQSQTFKYFWDYAHPVSGLARERLGSGDTVTSGGSGFGIMCLPVAVSRGFITRAEAAERMRRIVGFLSSAQTFHGAFPHWLDGSTGKVFPFSANDNGGDLVETAFLMQGLLAAAQFFDDASEADIRAGVDALWRAVEWDWYTRGGENVLYWHWSPDKDWAMNMPIRGWNEALIVYVLAAASPTHPVSASVYHNGWASGGSMRMTQNQPLFFAHYSFLGLDPRGLSDRYADYWAQNVAHARYNYDYCVRNPQHHAGYSASCWGLTASDYPGGYIASAPANDTGTIAPTAALASFPYTPSESLEALHYFYYKLGDQLWGTYGFRDAFCMDSAWFASSYLAIDQGPIVVMLENYRTGLLWELFMRDPDVLHGLSVLGFSRERDA